MTDRLTDQPINRPMNMRGHRKVTISFTLQIKRLFFPLLFNIAKPHFTTYYPKFLHEKNTIPNLLFSNAAKAADNHSDMTLKVLSM